MAKVELFKKGDVVVVKEKYLKEWLSIAKRRKEIYTIVSVEDVPKDSQKLTGHPQMIDYSDGKETSTASGRWFTKKKGKV
jgi:hypothetical protein